MVQFLATSKPIHYSCVGAVHAQSPAFQPEQIILVRRFCRSHRGGAHRGGGCSGVLGGVGRVLAGVEGVLGGVSDCLMTAVESMIVS